jgi:hypothetical protein
VISGSSDIGEEIAQYRERPDDDDEDGEADTTTDGGAMQ